MASNRSPTIIVSGPIHSLQSVRPEIFSYIPSACPWPQAPAPLPWHFQRLRYLRLHGYCALIVNSLERIRACSLLFQLPDLFLLLRRTGSIHWFCFNPNISCWPHRKLDIASFLQVLQTMQGLAFHFSKATFLLHFDCVSFEHTNCTPHQEFPWLIKH